MLQVLGAAAAGLALLVAGCDSPSDTSGEPVAAPSTPGVPTIKTRQVAGLGAILVDSRGMALYTNDHETSAARIVCTGECAEEWPPVTVTARTVPATLPGIKGRFTVVSRPDGKRQLARNGRPLYTFDQDRAPGQVHGNNFVDRGGHGERLVWHAATASGAVPSGTPSPR
jgi:predicted lipoprotein with Yx(FWY)xxD motif